MLFRSLIGSLRLEWPLCLRKVTACAALPRLELLYDLPLLLSSAAALESERKCSVITCCRWHNIAASAAKPPRQTIASLYKSKVGGNCVRLTNRRQSDSEDRSKSNRLDIKQGRHLIRQALQFFELLACNGGVKGQGPLRSLGGPRGIFSHVREYPPFPVQRLRRCFPPPRNTRKNIKKSTLTGGLFQIAEN